MNSLGKVVTTFGRTPFLNLVTFVLLSGSGAVMVVGVVGAISGSLLGTPLGTGLRWILGIGGGGVVAYLAFELLTMLWNFNLRVEILESGFTQRVRGNTWRVGWDEVEAIYRLSETKLRWIAMDGRSAVLGPLPRTAAGEALGMLASGSEMPLWAKAHEAVSKGHEVRFGPFTVDAKTIAYRGMHSPLDRVSVLVDRGLVRMDVQGSPTVFVSLSIIPNLNVLLRTLSFVAPPWASG